ncbi:MAG: hypothetical protein ACSLEY_02090 [Candidatus Saccharimonadales bacterium]
MLTYRYKVRSNTTKIISKVTKITAAIALVVGSFALLLPTQSNTASALSNIIYDSIPDPYPVNTPSVGYAATSTSEFGGQVSFDGSERSNPTVTVMMNSWACESGSWTSGCVTTPGTSFSHPVTLNIYNVNPDDSAGSLVASSTETFSMPYRPSAGGCGNATQWYDEENDSCQNGYAFNISFDFAGVTLPDNAIIGVAYNTSNYGADPLGTDTACYGTPAGCPYDSLNVGTSSVVNVGSALPTEDDAYLNSVWAGAYCDGGLGVGTFRLDAGCWGGYLPAFQVSVEFPSPSTADQCKKNGWKIYDGLAFKNQGDCVSWVQHNVNGNGLPAKTR